MINDLLSDMHEPGNYIPIKCYKGKKYFELSNHLGNVLAVITDRLLEEESSTTSGLIDYFKADLVSSSDYYPFGMAMGDRGKSGPAVGYRYGFNGMEKDDELKGNGNSYDFGARIYDPRLGQWLAVDPLAGKFPFDSPYSFAGNSPILYLDTDGEVKKVYLITYIDGKRHSAKLIKVDKELQKK